MEVDGDKEMNDNEETNFDAGGDDVGYGDDDNDNDDINDSDMGNNSGNSGFPDSFPTYAKRLMFLFDCETTGGSHYSDHIIEIASTVIIPDNTSITTVEFSSFVAHLNTYPVLVIQHLDRKISVIIFFSIEEMWHHSTNVVWSASILSGLQGNDAVD